METGNGVLMDRLVSGWIDPKIPRDKPQLLLRTE